MITELFPKIQAFTGSWLGTKNSLYYFAQSANCFSWVLFVSPYTTAIVRPQLPGSFTKLLRTRETFIFYFPNQKQRSYRWVEKTFGLLSARTIEFALRIFCFWRITIKMRRRWEIQIAWQDKTTILDVHHAFLYISLPSTARLPVNDQFHVLWRT